MFYTKRSIPVYGKPKFKLSNDFGILKIQTGSVHSENLPMTHEITLREQQKHGTAGMAWNCAQLDCLVSGKAFMHSAGKLKYK